MDISFLSALYAISGPFASVIVETPHNTEDARRLRELGWRAKREELAGLGADDATLAAIDPVFEGEPDEAEGHAVFAAGGRLLLDVPLDRRPRRETCSYGPLPHVMPLLAAITGSVPYALVQADRAGADIEVFGDLGRLVAAGMVEGERDTIERNAPGGWSQKRYQARAENQWESNAKEVADTVSSFARIVDARLIVGAGDVRALQFLREHLDKDVAGLFVTIDTGGRAAGTDEDETRRQVEQLVTEAAVRDDLAVVEKFLEERGQHDRAVEDLGPVVEALRRAQVETLVLDDDPSSTATLFAGPDPLAIALTERELRDLGCDQVWEVRADAAIVRALAGSGGDLVIVPGGVTVGGGIGAILRYADAATPVP